ncbi:hypothetical protein [Limobrevibacterium gyesilva]|uniref:Uncharacterized protein n=1 Tax=Limobrevibacterium gyesilva TaxID=2991712 RepID=A0AA41YQG0_9PROT|nr:hypothetical protein [Limobrevibacterium gyesilva]MCW3474595.1 hypothetical protein [Limobrevibacterium gyesilva]
MSIWAKYPDYSDDELRTLVALAAQALVEADPDVAGEDLLHISPRAAAREILPLVQGQDRTIDAQRIQQLLEDEELSSQLCVQLLGEIRAIPELADRVAAAYDMRERKMAVTETLLLAGALVILALKLKKISWGAGKGEVAFHPPGEVAKSFLLGLLKLG